MDRTKYRAVLTSVRQSQLHSERPCTDSGSDHPAAQAATLSRSVVCHRLFRTPQVWSALARNVDTKSHESRMYCTNEPIENHYRPSYFLPGHNLTTQIQDTFQDNTQRIILIRWDSSALKARRECSRWRSGRPEGPSKPIIPHSSRISDYSQCCCFRSRRRWKYMSCRFRHR